MFDASINQHVGHLVGETVKLAKWVLHILDQGGSLISLAKDRVGYVFSDPEAQMVALTEAERPIILTPREAAMLVCLYKRRLLNPSGRFDRAGRWYPSDDECCACCAPIRVPSGKWPYSMLHHCRSVNHVATRFGLNAKEIGREVNAIEAKYSQALLLDRGGRVISGQARGEAPGVWSS